MNDRCRWSFDFSWGLYRIPLQGHAFTFIHFWTYSLSLSLPIYQRAARQQFVFTFHWFFNCFLDIALFHEAPQQSGLFLPHPITITLTTDRGRVSKSSCRSSGLGDVPRYACLFVVITREESSPHRSSLLRHYGWPTVTTSASDALV